MINAIIVMSTAHSTFVLDGRATADALDFGRLLKGADVAYTSTMLSAECFAARAGSGFFGQRRIHDLRAAAPAPRRAAAPVLVPA